MVQWAHIQVSMVAQKNVLWNCLLVWILASNAFYALAVEDTEVRRLLLSTYVIKVRSQ